jgi:hypothetical protein
LGVSQQTIDRDLVDANASPEPINCAQPKPLGDALASPAQRFQKDDKEIVKQVEQGIRRQASEILYDVRFGIENAFDEMGFPKLG